jgi:ribosomal protein S18 acetylase RimI-like enzyme
VTPATTLAFGEPTVSTLFRKAELQDAPVLVQLQNIATEETMAVVWGAMGAQCGMTWQEVGIEEIGSDDHLMSFRMCMVAEVDGVVAGMVNYRLLTPGEWGDLRRLEATFRPYASLMQAAGKGLYIANIAVLPAYRRRGVAQGLMQVMLAGAEKMGLPQICAAIHQENAASTALFSALGLKPVASRTVLKHAVHPKGSKVLLFARPLTNEAAA